MMKRNFAPQCCQRTRGFNTPWDDIEVDILTVSVSEERADEIFEYIFIKADLYHRSNGFMYQCGLSEATTFQLPEIPKEEL